MARNSLLCADVPLRNYSLHSMFTVYTTPDSFSLGTSYCIEDVGLIKLTSMLLAVGTNRELTHVIQSVISNIL